MVGTTGWPVCWLGMGNGVLKDLWVSREEQRLDFLGGGNSYIFYVHPENLGKIRSNLTTAHIFQMGLVQNHQLD